MTSPSCYKSPQACGKCLIVTSKWHVDELIRDIEDTCKETLTPSEICWLRLLLYGLSPQQIAFHCDRSSSIAPELSRGIYRYVEALTTRKVEQFNDVKTLLELQNKYQKSTEDRFIIDVVLPSNIPLEAINIQVLVDALKQLEIKATVSLRKQTPRENKKND